MVISLRPPWPLWSRALWLLFRGHRRYAPGSLQGGSEGTPGVAFRVMTSAFPGRVEEPFIDLLRRRARLEQAADPSPFPAGWAGVGVPENLSRGIGRDLVVAGNRGYSCRIPETAVRRRWRESSRTLTQVPPRFQFLNPASRPRCSPETEPGSAAR
jgi:hypothetical protein